MVIQYWNNLLFKHDTAASLSILSVKLFICLLVAVTDVFDMLLPMLGIYQEYVRNHHYSLQVLAEYKQKPDFNQLLKRYEEKSICEGRSLATFLTYPMHQVPT